MALIDGSQHFNILQKSQNFKNLKKNLYLFLLFQKLGILFFMISKKISDLKDIKFKISTALQFEPSQKSKIKVVKYISSGIEGATCEPLYRLSSLVSTC